MKSTYTFIRNNKYSEDLYPFSGGFDSLFDPHYCGITYPNENYHVQDNASATYTFEYIYSGKGVLYVNNKPVELSKGDVFITHAFTQHHYVSDKKDPWHKIFLVIDGTMIGHLLSHFKLSHTNYIRDFNNSSYLEKIVEIGKENPNRHDTRLFSAVCDFLIALSEFKDSLAPTQAHIIKKFIDNNLDKKLTLEEISENVGYSRSQICRIYKEAFNISIYDYILNKKMILARRYLCCTDLPIGELAERLNFNSTHHFSNFVKKQTGYTPTQIRNSALE